MSLLDTPAGIEVLSHIYSAALDSAQWPGTVQALTDWIGGEIGCLQLRRLGPQPSVVLVASGTDPAFEDAYLQHYHRLDPHLTRVAQLPQGRTVLSREVVSDDELFGSEFYNDFFRPQGVCDLQGAMLIRNASHVVTFATESSLRSRYDEHTRARLDALVPHLTRAVHFTLGAQELSAAQQALLVASAAAGSGLLRVNASLAILEAADQTLAWLAQRDGALSAHDGRLLARAPCDQQQLRECVRAALNQGSTRCELNGDAAESVQLVASPAARSLLYPEPSAFILFSVLPRSAGAQGNRSVRAASGGTPPELLPPALRPVAESLQLGLSDKEIAERLQLPLATARTYVSRTLRRLGVRSRRELMVRR